MYLTKENKTKYLPIFNDILERTINNHTLGDYDQQDDLEEEIIPLLVEINKNDDFYTTFSSFGDKIQGFFVYIAFRQESKEKLITIFDSAKALLIKNVNYKLEPNDEDEPSLLIFYYKDKMVYCDGKMHELSSLPDELNGYTENQCCIRFDGQSNYRELKEIFCNLLIQEFKKTALGN